ncbi:questin oxidase family protein [Streptacidiphilus sp. N1-3]|uniref:Questin oxidase family protein n=1 Tax=Streptacidiphilus alkalitolerans TaxID=3342712 RepID=A0ABV6X898_9ACTN
MTKVSYEDAVNDALERLDDLGYERGAQGDLANHGPMGAETLAVLGHGDKVAGWVEGYRKVMPHHEPPAPRFALDAADESSWRPALGAFDRAGDWEQLFRRELAEAPWRTVLARWWPRLLPGLFAGLTHGPIRTAHAVRSIAAAPQPTPLQMTELARALAYWAARYTQLPGKPQLTGSYDVAAAVAALPRLRGEVPVTPPVARKRLEQLDRMPGYFTALDSLAPDQAQWLLSEMTAEFAGVYLAHDEIFAVPMIHAVTAPAAVRLVLPHLPLELHEPSIAALWHVHTAFLLAFTRDRRGEQEAVQRATESDLPSFDELSARAVEHGDEHVIKFTEACLREHTLRPDRRFPAAALAAQQRIDAR